MKALKLSLALIAAIAVQASAAPRADEWAEKLHAIAHVVCESIRGECVVNYSAYDVDENDLPINNLHDTAIEGRVIVIANHNPFWGKGRDYRSQAIENPSWLDLAIIANEVIIATGDRHHVYLEGFEIVKKASGATYIELAFGS